MENVVPLERIIRPDDELQACLKSSQNTIRIIVDEMARANQAIHKSMRTIEELTGLNLDQKACCAEIAKLLLEISDVAKSSKTQSH